MLVLAEGVTFALRFLRTIVLARLLLPADFGIAATFMLTVQFLDLLSDLGADKLLLQCPEEQVERVQSVWQSLAAVRGVITGALIFVSAGLLARMFNAPQAVIGFRLLGLLPVLQGFTHQDIVRAARHAIQPLRHHPGGIDYGVNGAGVATRTVVP